MNTRPLAGFLFAGLFLAGCTAPALPPDAADHPANPEAPSAAAPPASQTLALQERAAPPATAPAGYTCPHHPEVLSSQPGDCPKCGMALTPKPATQPAKGQNHSGHHDHSGHGGHGGHR